VSLQASCPDGDGWIQSDGHCYLISPTGMTWYEAQEYCWGKGGYLAEIKAKDQQNAINQILHSEAHYWIGLNDLAEEGVFKWAESHDNVGFTNWHSGEPNNRDNEDCVMIWVNGLWNDSQCNWSSFEGVRSHAICQPH